MLIFISFFCLHFESRHFFRQIFFLIQFQSRNSQEKKHTNNICSEDVYHGAKNICKVLFYILRIIISGGIRMEISTLMTIGKVKKISLYLLFRMVLRKILCSDLMIMLIVTLQHLHIHINNNNPQSTMKIESWEWEKKRDSFFLFLHSVEPFEICQADLGTWITIIMIIIFWNVFTSSSSSFIYLNKKICC